MVSLNVLAHRRPSAAQNEVYKKYKKMICTHPRSAAFFLLPFSCLSALGLIFCHIQHLSTPFSSGFKRLFPSFLLDSADYETEVS